MEKSIRPEKHYLVNKVIADFCKKNQRACPGLDIEACFLPVAMCELNPIELAWGYLKGCVRRDMWKNGFQWRHLDGAIKFHYPNLGSKNYQAMFEKAQKQVEKKRAWLEEIKEKQDSQ